MSASPGWFASLKVYAHPRVAGMFFLGFSAGLPLILVLGTLSYWLREAGVDRSTIGYFSWIGLAYGFKWVWSPLVDRLPLPLLTRLFGRRRAWLLLSQLAIAAALVGMAGTDPAQALERMAWCALAVAFASATQDIALDAYRIEAVEQRLQGAMAATYQGGYRIAMIVASAGVLWLAASVDLTDTAYEHGPWRFAYLVMAACMGVGVVTTLLIREPDAPVSKDTVQREARTREWLAREGLHGPLLALAAWVHGAVVSPFVDFVRRYRWQAVLLLALIGSYRISDVVMGIMANAFYVDMGYTKDEVASVAKVYGVGMTIAGAAIGGVLTAHGRHEDAVPGRPAVVGHQSAVRLAGRPRPRRERPHFRGVGGQPVGRHRLIGFRGLSVRADQCGLLGHPVRAVQLADAAAAEIRRRLFRRLCGRPRL